MVRAKFGRRIGLAVTGYHVLQLCCGSDLFKHLAPAFGDDIEAMRRAWKDPEVRAATRAKHYSKFGPHSEPWATLAFGADGKGGIVKSAADIETARRAYLEQRDGTP